MLFKTSSKDSMKDKSLENVKVTLNLTGTMKIFFPQRFPNIQILVLIIQMK